MISERLIAIYERMEEDLLKLVAKRFADAKKLRLVNEYDWQTRMLEEMGWLRQESVKTIARLSGKAEAEIERILQKAGRETIDRDERMYRQAYAAGALGDIPVPADMSPRIQRVIQAAAANAKTALNLVNTTAAESAMRVYIDTVNRVYLETVTGVSTYTDATRRAVRELADKGITGATYTSAAGRVTRAHLDVAVRRAVVTSVAQVAGGLQLERARDWGVNLVEVSAHIGARPEHEIWQGRIYSIDGGTRKYPNLVDATGYGEVTGLMGANCRHMFYPYFEGYSTPATRDWDTKENAKVYEATQRQRVLERDIRKYKRRAIAADAAGDTEAAAAARTAINHRGLELSAHIKKHSTLVSQSEREYVEGYKATG